MSRQRKISLLRVIPFKKKNMRLLPLPFTASSKYGPNVYISIPSTKAGMSSLHKQTTHTHTHKTQTRRENIQHHTHLISRSTIIILILLPLFNDDITTPIIGYRIENTIETIISLAMHLILCLIADRMTYEDSRYTIGVQNLCLIVSLIRESRRNTCTRGKTRALEKPGIMNDTGRARTSVCQC